jgi:hypothetical protein
MHLVPLTWFRDEFLPGEVCGWAESETLRQESLCRAIERGFVLTITSPEGSGTGIRVNRIREDVQAMLGQRAACEDAAFSPIEIPGDSLSSTVLRDRR